MIPIGGKHDIQNYELRFFQENFFFFFKFTLLCTVPMYGGTVQMYICNY